MRQARAWHMWRSGYPVKQIALHIGISETSAKQMLKTVKQKLALTIRGRD